MRGVLAVAVVVLAGAAHGEVATAAPRLIAAPSGGALVTHDTVRVAVNRRAGATVRVRLNNRNVTSRLRVTGGRLVGTLRRRDGLRSGQNHLVVTSERKGHARRLRARSFFVVRRSRHFARVRLTGGMPAALRIDIVSGGSRRALAHRRRIVRVALNGRSISKVLRPRTGTRWTASLSEADGLRFGANRIRVFVAEPRSGRFASLSRGFVLPRGRPLASAGTDTQARPGNVVRLGNTDNRAARGGRLTYRWSLITRPAGSRAKLRGVTTARPSLVPDQPGHYVARVRVSEQGTPTLKTSVDDVGVDVGPTASLLPLGVNAFPVEKRGIRIGDTFFQHPGSGGSIQVLILDRRSPTAASGAINTSCCGGKEPLTAQKLAEKLGELALDKLVIIAIPAQRTVVGSADYQPFNEALEAIGVQPVKEAELANRDEHAGEQIVAIGIPSAGEGSGWLMRSHHANPELKTTGWLMPDGDLSAGYRFQPLQVPFNTRAAGSTATSNTMTIGEQTVKSDTVPSGASAYHLVEVRPTDLSVVRNVTYMNDAAGRNRLRDALLHVEGLDPGYDNSGRNDYVALQSIGPFSPQNPGWSDDSQTGGVQLNLSEELGGDPHYANYRSPRYAFFGGKSLGRRGAAQSNAGLPIDAADPELQTGTLSGDARMGPDGHFILPTGDATDSPAASLYNVLFDTPTTPYPYATGPYVAAMAYISRKLSDTSVNPYGADFTATTGATFSQNIRGAYLGLPDYKRWDKATDALDKIHYPGKGAGACQGPPVDDSTPGFTLLQFCQLKAQLRQEFVDLVVTKEYTDDLVEAMQLAADAKEGVLNSTYTLIKEKVDPPEDSEIAAPLLGLLYSLAEFADLAEVALAPEVAAAAGLAADLVEITSAVSTDSGKPVGQVLDDSVRELGANLQADVASGARSLDSIRATAMSDWGRLTAFADAARAVGSETRSQVTDQLVNGGGRYFASALMEKLKDSNYYTFRIYSDGSGADGTPDPRKCSQFDGVPDGAWMRVLWKLDSWSSLVFGYPGSYSSDFPPGEILGQMFGSPRRGAPIAELGRGYGIDKSTWLWQQTDYNTQKAGVYVLCGN